VPFARDARGTILHAADFSPHDGEMRNVSFIEPGADGSPGALITADRAVYDPERGTWRLEDFARRISMSGGDDDGLAGSVRSGGVDEYPFEMTPDQILLRQSSQWGEMMSMRQMSALIAETDLPNRPSIVKSFDIRFSKPLLFWILLLITIPYFLTCEPTNVIVAGGRALLIGGICFGVTFVIQSLPPDAWPGRFGTAIPVLVFGPWALLKMANLRT
jgi:lipopolysaccharide export LptBFGC system permease protein LptF